MDKRDTLARILAIAGTALIWLNLLAPLVLGLLSLIFWQRFRFDFLMPVELFMLGLLGGLLLLWIALRARLLRAEVAWSLGVAVAALVGTRGIAVITGFGRRRPRAGGVAACGGDGSL